MNYVFRVRVADMGLFDNALWTPPKPGPGKGQPEAKARRERFATRADGDVWELALDDTALAIISDEMELDAEGPGFTFQRYADAGHREKSRGIGGSTLGDIGEILVWLAHRFAGRELVRVVGYKAWNPTGGGPFPQPDFLVGGAGLRALEVKSREAFDYIALKADGSGTTIAACDPLNEARSAAMLQIGFDPEDHNPLTVGHYLKANIGGVHRVVPFPCSMGVATVVLVRDARVSHLQDLHASGAKTFKPKTPCTARTCWGCFSSTMGDAHAAIVEMPNEPGKLLLPGREGGDEWLQSYRRWAAAMRARDPLAVAHSQDELARANEVWLPRQEETRETLAQWLHYLWVQYPSDVAYDRGLAPQRAVVEPPFDEWRLSMGPPSLEPIVSTTLDELPTRLRDAGDRVASFSVDLRPDGGTAVVHRSPDGVRVHLTTPHWWHGAALTDNEVASIVDMLWAVVRHALEFEFPFRAPPVKRVVVTRSPGDETVLLGWATRFPTRGTDPRGWHAYWREWWEPFGPFHPRMWMLDGFRLYVTTDGRAVFAVAPRRMGARP